MWGKGVEYSDYVNREDGEEKGKEEKGESIDREEREGVEKERE